jgi:hypothetical protein
MFCPNCKSEFIEGIGHCPDCDVDLVSELPAGEDFADEEISGESDWVMIYSPSSVRELAMIKMILERDEIPYFIGNDNTRRAALYVPSNLGFELWVTKKWAKKTIQLLERELDIR